MTSPRSRRGIRSLAVLLIAAGLTIAPVVPASACACGGVAPSPGSEVSVGEERAIISWQDGVERIDLLLGVLSSDSHAGLVFPTPAPATVTLGDRADFEAIGRVTTPERVEEYDWWTIGGAGGGDGAPAGGAPEVLATVQLGPIEAVTLAASDTTGLQTWLTANDYALSPEVTALLDGYVQRGWFFVALKLTGEAPLDGGLDPLTFTFESDELVYPLELSRAATTPQTVRLYVFDGHRQNVSFVGAGTPAASFTSWAAPVTGTEVEAFGDYLTVFELYFSDPPGQILGDLTFANTLTDETTGTKHTVIVPVGLFGMPLGWLLTGLAIFAAFGAILVASAVGAKRS